jgi:hypothetical protein
MLVAELPKSLQEEFERTAQLLHGQDQIRQALIEAIELWLTQQHQKLIETEALANNSAFEQVRNELEQNYPNKWIIIAHGKFLGAADTLEEMNHLAPTARHRIAVQMGQTRPKEVELGWQIFSQSWTVLLNRTTAYSASV